MPDTPPDITVSHNAARQRFEVALDGHRGVAQYEIHGKVMRLTHTVVDPELEGRGIGSALAQAAMAHARAGQLSIDPQCSYMRAYMERHPETHDLRV